MNKIKNMNNTKFSNMQVIEVIINQKKLNRMNRIFDSSKSVITMIKIKILCISLRIVI